jgi:TP901 family phage tail tape measure protein
MAFGLSKLMKETAAYDDALRNLAAKIGIAFDGKKFKGVRDEIAKLGKETAFTAKQVADLAIVLAQGGKSAKEIQGITRHVLELARAMSEDTADSARIAQSAMDAYGLSVEDARRAADVLAYTVNNSNQGLIDLGEANNYVATTARDAGMSIERVSAMLAVMADNGIRGSRAGVQLRAAFLQLTTRGADLAEELDIDLTDTAGEFRDFGVILEEFRKATEDMTDVEKFEKYKKAFGKVGISSALILGRSKKELDQFTNELKNSFGTAEEAAKAMDAGIGGSFRKLYSAAENVWLGVGQYLAPSIQKATLTITHFIKKLGSNEKLLKEIAAFIPKLAKYLIQFTTVLFATAAGLAGISTAGSGFLALLGFGTYAASKTSAAVVGTGLALSKLNIALVKTAALGNKSVLDKMSKGYNGLTTSINKAANATGNMLKKQLAYGDAAKKVRLETARASAQQLRIVRKEAQAIASNMSAANSSSLKEITRIANSELFETGTKLSPRQVAGARGAVGRGTAAGAYSGPISGNAGGTRQIFSSGKPAKKGVFDLADRLIKGIQKGTPKSVSDDLLTAGIKKGSSGVGGTIAREAPASLKSQYAAKNTLASKRGSVLKTAQGAFQDARMNNMFNALPKSGQGGKIGKELVTKFNGVVAKGIRKTPSLMMKGFVGALKVTKWGPQALAFTLIEGLVVGVTGSEAQAAYGLAGDFMNGAIFTGFAKGAKAGGIVIADGIKAAIGFAMTGDWASAWQSLTLSLETGWRTLMANMSDGVKTFVSALNNFQSGSFVTFLRTIWRGFTSLASILGEVIDGVVYMLSLGNVSNFTGADFGQHLDDMNSYDGQLESNKKGDFFSKNDRKLQELKHEKDARDVLLKQAQHAAAQEAKNSEAMSWRNKQIEEQRSKLRLKRDKELSKEENRKKEMQRDELARMKTAHEADRKGKIEVAKEQLRQLGIVAKVEADAESGRESIKYSKMTEVTKKLTRSGIGGLGGEGVMRQFAEKQNDVHKQNLDSQHRQESELRQINASLKKHALESLLLKP